MRFARLSGHIWVTEYAESASRISWPTRRICTRRLEVPLDGVSATSMWNILNIVCFLTVYINGKAGKVGPGISGQFSFSTSIYLLYNKCVHVADGDRYYFGFILQQSDSTTNDSSPGRAKWITVHRDSQKNYLKITVQGIRCVRMINRAGSPRRFASAMSIVAKCV